MLSSEFNQELGSLIRSLETRVQVEPALTQVGVMGVSVFPAVDHIDRAIITLIALRLSITRRSAE